MSENTTPTEKWDKEIVPKRGLLDIPWRELWRYRDMIWLLSQRDRSANYKQTVLGPVWFIIQPLMTTFAFSFLFGRMAKLGTDHIPHFLFYMSGLVAWNFFSECVNKTSISFTRNAQVFGKVYFPRLAVPLSSVITSLMSFGVQFATFLIGLGFYLHEGNAPLHPNWRIALVPLLILQVAMLGLGVGCIVASLSTRYRDFTLGIGFFVQIWMYASSIVFPLSRIAPSDRWVFYLNPMVPVIESIRLAFLGSGLVEKFHVMTSFGVSALVLTIGIIMFNRAEQTVMDTV